MSLASGRIASTMCTQLVSTFRLCCCSTAIYSFRTVCIGRVNDVLPLFGRRFTLLTATGGLLHNAALVHPLHCLTTSPLARIFAASILEQPCYCPLSDVECMAHQRTMIPNNPCIEKAMLDYSRLMGYNTPTAAKSVSIETNRVYDADFGNQSLDRRLYNQAGEPLGHRGGTSPEASIEYSETRPTGSGRARQSWNRNESGEIRDGYGEENLREKDKGKADWSGGAGDGEERVTELAPTDGPDESEAEAHKPMAAKGKESSSAGSRRGGSKSATTAVPVWSSTRRKSTGSTEGSRKGKPRTTLSPMPTEQPPPWETTTTQPPPTTFVTHAPPPAGELYGFSDSSIHNYENGSSLGKPLKKGDGEN
ncbi:hypothetical protein GCK32_009516 [Trichostrongylus colubriformis]|uniref:Uncharacterized protein n=1 Tax=Trichostrongylus colubriformis TaxID=6319 RepID=A0AAN8EQT6_TRICO